MLCFDCLLCYIFSLLGSVFSIYNEVSLSAFRVCHSLNRDSGHEDIPFVVVAILGRMMAICVPKDLIREVERFMESRPELGFESVEEFFREALRRSLIRKENQVDL